MPLPLRLTGNDTRLRNAPFGFLALLATTVGVLSGCAEQACFAWSQAEGACPARADALQFFCAESVGSVESEGVAQDGLCCYDVIKRDDYRACGVGQIVDNPPPSGLPTAPAPVSCDALGDCMSAQINSFNCAANDGCGL